MVTTQDFERIMEFLNEDVETLEKHYDKIKTFVHNYTNIEDAINKNLEVIGNFIDYWRRTSAKYERLIKEDKKQMKGRKITATKKPATRKTTVRKIKRA